MIDGPQGDKFTTNVDQKCDQKQDEIQDTDTFFRPVGSLETVWTLL